MREEPQEMDSKHVFILSCVCKGRASKARLESGPWTSVLLLTEPLMLSKHNLGSLQLKLLLWARAFWVAQPESPCGHRGSSWDLGKSDLGKKLLELFSVSSLLTEEALKEPCFC